MYLKILAIITLVAAVLTTGCGLSIHFKWVGDIKATPHLVLGGITVLLVFTTTLAALLGK